MIWAHDESPSHGFDVDMTHHAMVSNYLDFKACIVLLEHNPYESAYDVLWNLGQAFRDARPAAGSVSRGIESSKSSETMEQRWQ